MDFVLGLVIMAAYGVAIWMFIEAVRVPSAWWEEIGREQKFSAYQSKTKFFVWWCVGGWFTMGLIPIGLSFDFYRRLRPQFRAMQEAGRPAAFAAVPAVVAAGTPVDVTATQTSAPGGWYGDPTGRHQFRYWDGAGWTAHVSNNGITALEAAPPQGFETATTP